jgi:hypothetical protein
MSEDPKNQPLFACSIVLSIFERFHANNHSILPLRSPPYGGMTLATFSLPKLTRSNVGFGRSVSVSSLAKLYEAGGSPSAKL